MLLWAFISLNPFGDRRSTRSGSRSFWLGGIAIAHGLLRPPGRRFAALAAFATAAVLIIGVWNVLWVILSIGQRGPAC